MSGDNQIRIGLITCKNIVRKLSRAINLSLNATISAIATTSSIEEAKSFTKSNNFPPNTKIHSSYESLLEDPDVDAVYFPIPTRLHLEWAVRAARKGKHILLDKPVALNVSEFDQIVEACAVNGVQFMDGTQWMHNPRTYKIKEFVNDLESFGLTKTVHSCFSFAANEDFLKHDIRVKPGLDGLGALGDAGWYTIQAILLANDFKLPKTVAALPGFVLNDAGIVLACGALFNWEEGISGTIYCSFLANLTMEITAIGTKGTLRVHDFVIPYRETEAAFTTSARGCVSEHKVMTELPQEACMVIEFARLVGEIKYRGAKPDGFWLSISRKTQLLVDAVKESIDNNLEPVFLSGR
ncbi:Oxidoreductase N-terminal [Arabidopsis suecica]|uniref:Oxidoreductase N-terminal n=1 Tax=Arabidopsis suecica TaxID=45249 RepID=A0A8T2CNM3_ARASU|nr:Oxidoreductase N-terminal [Arabidopsis suecica]